MSIGRPKQRFDHLHTRYIPDGGSDPDSIIPDPATLKYREEDYIFAASNPAGQSARLQCRVQPTLFREVQQVLQARRFPFRTDSDIVRWCIHYGMEELSKREPSPGFLAKAQAEIELLRDQEYWDVQRELVKKLDDAVRRCVNAGQYVEAKRLVLNTLAGFSVLEESTWRDQFLAEVKDKFKHVLEYGRRSEDVL